MSFLICVLLLISFFYLLLFSPFLYLFSTRVSPLIPPFFFFFQVQQILNALEGELKGNYYSLIKMDKITQQRLIDDHFLFKEGDRFLEAANANRFWPVGE